MQSIEFTSKYTQLSKSLTNASAVINDDDKWEDALDAYDEKVNDKRHEMAFDVYDDWVNGQDYLDWHVKELATVIYVHQGENDWQNHYHATLCVKVESPSRRQFRYVEFSHAALMIQCFSITGRDWNRLISGENSTRRVLAHVTNGGNATLEIMMKQSIAHWYNVNGNGRQIIQWPASCTGFTDFLMFYLFGKNYLNKCILSLAYNKSSHAIYREEGIEKVNINKMFNTVVKITAVNNVNNTSPKRTRSGAVY